MANLNVYEIKIVSYIGGGKEVHRIAPIALTDEEYEKKIESYSNYQQWEYFTATCLDDYDNKYEIILNNAILQSSYFTFISKGTVSINKDE